MMKIYIMIYIYYKYILLNIKILKMILLKNAVF